MLAEILQAQRHRVADQLTEQPAAGREGAQRVTSRLVEADGDEPREPGAVLVEQPEGPVARVDQVDRLADDPGEGLLEVQAVRHGDHGPQQPVGP